MLNYQGMKRKAAIKCPTCKREGDWFSEPYGPFCSRRCKLVDLGKWFREEHLISQPLRPDSLQPGSEHPEESNPSDREA